ncbi:hypothetical membrane DUF2232 [Gottschalkia purinilytica]|uniref:Hypothetical membrane DUF2232 n=1 Tax=Gottschalkia purinilytica TaxID=1503 RepID=A0A0L0W788_GOTPU|nr:DUF2232 domain-containing protein [Gottschalkia purinilytica]KNF07140.1 hypothetical membrane DUF2232 [Gottschalkia purinilytica]
MDKNKSNSAIELIITIIITSMLTILGLYVSPLILIFYPVLHIVLGVKQGMKYTLLSIVTSSIIAGFSSSYLDGLYIFTCYGLLGIALTYMISKEKTATKTIAVGSIVYLVCIALYVILSKELINYDIIGEFSKAIKESVTMQVQSLKNSGLSNYEISQASMILEDVVSYILIVIPSFMILTSVFVTYISYLISTHLINKKQIKDVYVPKFMYFKLPDNFIVGVIILLLLSSITIYFEFLYYEGIFMNIIILIFLGLFVQGLSLTTYILNKSNMSKVIKYILLVLIVINVFSSIIVAIVGLLDVFFDFRKLKKA